MKKLNILCEIDLLGRAEINKEHRTGLFCVCENIINELSKNKNINISFCSITVPSKYCNKYLKTNSLLKDYKCVWLGSFKDKLFYTLNNKRFLVKKRVENSKNKVSKKFWKFAGLCFRLLRGIVKFIPSKEFDINQKFNHIDVYQSFYFAIPSFINKNQKIKKAIFVYDLIPLKFPELVNVKKKKLNNKPEQFCKILDSIQKNTLIFSISDYTKKDLIKFYPNLKNNKIITTYLAADKEKFFVQEKKIEKSLKKYNISLDKPYFLSLCSLNPRKNLEFTVDCFVEFLEKNKIKDRVNLVLAGPGGWQFDSLLNKIDKNGKFKENIIVTGFIDDQDINSIYNEAFGFVYPSLYEGFGLPVLEAMQCGIPVITSNTSSLPEVAENAAIIVDPKNKKELIKGFEDLYKDDKLRKKLIKDGLNRSKKFEWEKTVDKVIKEYINIL